MPATTTKTTTKPRLSDLAVRNLQPRAERYIEWYADGLGVRVAPTGHKVFLYWFPFAGRKRRMSLGTYPATTVREALEAHTAARLQVQRGIDPAALAAEEAAEADEAATTPPTLREVFPQWLATLAPYTDSEGQRHGRKDGGALLLLQARKHVFPVLGDTALADVSRGAVLELLDKIKADGKRRTASVVFSMLRQFLDWAAERERIPYNPLATLRRAKTVGRAVVRTRALQAWEVSRLLQRLPTVDMHPLTVLALRFVLATGQRPGEVAGMPKSELDKAGTLWVIPPTRYKTNQEQRVPLSAHARRILGEAAKHNEGSAYVFPSPQSIGTDTDAPIERHSLSRAVLRKLGDATPEGTAPADGVLGLAAFRPHDLRRTCRTHLARLGIAESVAERVLGHRPGGMVGTYDTHDYLAECRAALDLWGATLDKLAKAKAKTKP
jgi:integrase